MTSLHAIADRIRQAKPALMKQYGLSSIGLFGSAVRGDWGQDSDLDILVEFSRPVGMEFIELADALESLTGRRVDLVSRRGLSERSWNFIKDELFYV
jgi:predicted nucleotidyltransferase